MTNKILSIKKYSHLDKELNGSKLIELNEFRKLNDLKPLVEKTRNCLNCNKQFRSIKFRLCNNCRQYANNNSSNFDVWWNMNEENEIIKELMIENDNLRNDKKNLVYALENILNIIDFNSSELTKLLQKFK